MKKQVRTLNRVRTCFSYHNSKKETARSDARHARPAGGLSHGLGYRRADPLVKGLGDNVLGAQFLIADEPCQCFRTNFSTPTDQQLEKGIKILGQLVNELI